MNKFELPKERFTAAVLVHFLHFNVHVVVL
jgi:hypothetical protein